MQIYSYISDLQQALLSDKIIDKKIALVPTMGNLHEGHLSLVDRAKKEADIVIVSIFVNPLQFGINEDLDNYPRTLEEDINKLTTAGTHYLFTPVVKEIYPDGLLAHTTVSVPGITQPYCGIARPTHFDGVTSIVIKLFNIVQPDVAIFGNKDFQQLAVIRKMVEDLCIPIDIIGSTTGRADDGLALSSRNQYLTDNERKLAPMLHNTLLECREQTIAYLSNLGQTELGQIRLIQIKLEPIVFEHTHSLTSAGFAVDYFAICDAKTLANISAKTKEVVILTAATLGKTRLLDNVTFSLPQA